jgi:hypothetical protein
VFLISPANTVPVSQGTFTMVVKLLSVLCRNCPSLPIELIENTDIISILRDVLSGSPQSMPETKDELVLGSPSHMTRPSEQLSELLSLCVELLPPLPKSEIFAAQGMSTPLSSLASSSSGSLRASHIPRPPKTKRKDKGSGESSPFEEKSKSSAASRGEEVEGSSDPRIKFLKEHSQVMEKFSSVLLPVVRYLEYICEGK